MAKTSPRDLTDQVAIVTGASSGIGLAVAQKLVQRGARVALVARTAARLDEIAKTLGPTNAAAFALDVTDRAVLGQLPERVRAHFGRLDIVVNNAGVNHRGLVRERTAEELIAVVETNLVAPILLTKAALSLLSPGGVVVNVASLAGKIPVPDEATYSASKSGLRAFGRALDLESSLHHHDVRVATVCPGPVDTGFFGENIELVPDLVFSQPMSSADQVADAVMRAIDGEAQEIDVPAVSGKLATLGYLSPRVYSALRPVLEKRGSLNKSRYIARKRR